MSQQIQWFPGHMAKALREMREKIRLVDLTFILLDSRLPKSSLNPEVLKIVKRKPIVLLFNKSDLADTKILNRWLESYQSEGYICHAINAKKGVDEKEILKLSKRALEDKFKRFENKNLNIPVIRAMITGIPNVGKSTFINKIVGSKATKTANTPGITRNQQWIRINEDFDLLDTPGVLWGKFQDKETAYNLAITGAIKDSVLPEDEVAIYALGFLKQYYPKQLEERYGVGALSEDVIKVLDHIGNIRGAFLLRKEIDYDRVYQIVLTDIRNGYLGEITFDRI